MANSFHSPRDLETSRSSKCTSTAQACRNWWVGAGALLDCALVVVTCTFPGFVVTFRGRRNGNLVLWRSKVGFSSGFTSMCRFRGRLILWTRWWSSKSSGRSDFVAGTVNRDLGTCGSFSKVTITTTTTTTIITIITSLWSPIHLL